MKHSIKLMLLGFLLIFLFSCSTQQAASHTSRNNLSFEEQAQAIADVLVSDYGTTSVQYALIDHGRIVLSGSSGVFDKTSNRPVGKDDMYGIGSTSKMLVATAVMMLHDQGKVDLDASLTTYIPSFTMADERYKAITVRMLLNHSSGLNGSTLANSFLFDDNRTLTHDTLLENLATQRLKADPGAFSEYCNDGFSLLEILVEQISGMSYTEFLTKYISQPLGLENTKTPLDELDRTNRIVRLYHPAYEGALPTETINVLGTGGLYSTSEDLCRFAQVLMGTKPEILSLEAVQMMQAEEYKKGMWIEHTGDNFFAFGLGWDTVHGYPFSEYGLQAFFKGGDTLLFHSALLVIPSLEKAVAIVSSGSASVLDYIVGATIMEHYLLEKGEIDRIYEPPLPSKPVRSEMSNEYEAYSGLYADSTSMVEVSIKDGILSLKPLGAEKAIQYIYTGNRLFQSEEENKTLLFSSQSDGNVYIQSNRIIDVPKLGKVPFISFIYQKLEKTELDPSLLPVWNNRAGKAYYPISEVSTAQLYFLNSALKLVDDPSSGYILGGAKIVDENLAINTVKFRDVGDLIFKMIGAEEYLFMNDMAYICEDAIPTLTMDTTSCLIGEVGYAKYYDISEALYGKTLVVSLPEGGAYAVYDKDGTCINFTTISKNNKTVLPQEGKVVFVGETGDRFNFTFL